MVLCSSLELGALFLEEATFSSISLSSLQCLPRMPLSRSELGNRRRNRVLKGQVLIGYGMFLRSGHK